ncbi:MAG: aspartate carbamoyltransferase [Oscillospiraceae bacterium]|nr:aspartate carbamoyltransferase [Oscillospiraceae bacterium]
MRNLVSVEDITIERWDALYSRCCDMIANPGEYVDSCRGKVLASLFYEPSTRTNFSFQAAAMRLGAGTFGFSDSSTTSISKGESLADTIRVAASYADTVVIRSKVEGAARAASLYSPVPVINAGDGGHMHPTQTLADLTTIAQRRGRIENLRVGICGDLKYGRTAHSLIIALAAFPGITFRFISPRDLRMPDYSLDFLRTRGIEYEESTLLDESMPELDILYMTRIQEERFEDKDEFDRLHGTYVLTKNLLERASGDMLIMHPLPRDGEILPEVDSDNRAVYFDQVRNGMFIRMALLFDFLQLPRITPSPPESDKRAICRNPVCVTNKEPYLPPLNAADGGCGYCDK